MASRLLLKERSMSTILPTAIYWTGEHYGVVDTISNKKKIEVVNLIVPTLIS